MPTTSTESDLLAGAFHALSDTKRLGIIRLLASGERCVCELTDVVRAKQSLLSFHLKILREADLVRARRCGKWMYYSLNYEALEQIKVAVCAVIDGRDHSESCCCESLCCPSEHHRET